MNKKAKKIGMTNLLRENNEVRRCYKMCQVLPLLPAASIAAGYQSIVNYAVEQEVVGIPMVTRFLQYVEKVWINGKLTIATNVTKLSTM